MWRVSPIKNLSLEIKKSVGEKNSDRSWVVYPIEAERARIGKRERTFS